MDKLVGMTATEVTNLKQDPAEGWLGYAVDTTDEAITFMEAYWKVG